MSQSELALVDQDGVPRIILSATRDRSLTHISGNGGTGLQFGVAGEQCSLQMMKSNGRMGVLMTSNETDVAVQIADDVGRFRLLVRIRVQDLVTTVTLRSVTGEIVREVRVP